MSEVSTVAAPESETPANSDALSLQQLEAFLDDIQYQPRWRPEADRAADYYDGNQLEPAIVAQMRERGQPVLVHNLIAPAIDGVLGLEAKTRTNWTVLADDDSGLDVAEGLNVELNEAARLSLADRACADGYAAQVKSGLGWVQVDRDPDPFKYKWRCNYVHRREIFWDWHSTRADLEDCRWLMRRKWLDLDQLMIAFPKHKELIGQISNRWNSFRRLDELEVLTESPSLMNAYQTQIQSNLNEDDWWDSMRKRALTYEVYYRVYVRKNVLISSSGGVYVYDENNPVHIAAVNSGKVRIENAMFSKMRLAYFIGPHRIADIESPHPHNKFPYVPFFGFREDRSRSPYGLIRRMMPAQDEINFRRSKLTMLLNKLLVVKDQDAVSGMSDDQLVDELLRGDSVVNLSKNRSNKDGRFDVIWGSEISDQQFKVMMEAKQLIQDTAGIYSAFLGQESGAKSGVAIDSLVEQGTTTMGELNDNYRFARQLVGELLMANIIDDIGEREHTVKTNVNKPAKTKVIKFNERVQQGDRMVITNRLTQTKTKVVLSDINSTPGYRQQIARALLEVVGRLPEQYQPALIDMVIEMLDIPAEQRNEMLKRIRQVSGMGLDPEEMSPEQLTAMQRKEQLQQLMEDIQVEQAKLSIDQLAAKIRETNAKAAKTEGETGSISINDEKTVAETDKLRGELKKIITDIVQARRLLATSISGELDQLGGTPKIPNKAA